MLNIEDVKKELMVLKLKGQLKSGSIDFMGEVGDGSIKCSINLRPTKFSNITVYYNDPHAPKEEMFFNGTKEVKTLEEALDFVQSLDVLKISKRIKLFC